MDFIEPYVVAFSDLVWSYVLYLIIGGGTFLLLYSRFMPFRYVKHALDLIRGRYDDPDGPGDVSHFKALVSALSATIGMGNISGVAIAITTGGPGAVFWMWVSAFVGMATKFFTSSGTSCSRRTCPSKTATSGSISSRVWAWPAWWPS